MCIRDRLKAIYKDAAEIILDNADSTLFLGGRGKNAKDISDNLGPVSYTHLHTHFRVKCNYHKTKGTEVEYEVLYTFYTI